MTRADRSRLAALALVLVLPACGGAATSSSGAPTSGAAGAAPAALTISAHDFGFSPTSLNVAPGSKVTVTFVNTGSVKHNLTASTVNVNVDGDPGSTQSASFTAPHSGAIAFHCEYHPTLMTGTITVGAAAAPASAPAASPSPPAGPSYGY